MKYALIAFLLLGFLFSCKKEEEDLRQQVNNQLNGSWSIKAQYIDGNQQFYVEADSTEFVFIKQDELGGILRWRDANETNNFLVVTGYEVSDNGKSIVLSEDDMGHKYFLEFMDDQLVMSGDVGTHFWKFLTKRK